MNTPFRWVIRASQYPDYPIQRSWVANLAWDSRKVAEILALNIESMRWPIRTNIKTFLVKEAP